MEVEPTYSLCNDENERKGIRKEVSAVCFAMCSKLRMGVIFANFGGPRAGSKAVPSEILSYHTLHFVICSLRDSLPQQQQQNTTTCDLSPPFLFIKSFHVDLRSNTPVDLHVESSRVYHHLNVS